MAKSKSSPKEQAKRFIDGRAAQRKPLPSREAIRRKMGWDLIEANRERKPK